MLEYDSRTDLISESVTDIINKGLILIKDAKTRDAILAFQMVQLITKEVYGKAYGGKIPTDVITKAIEAGSFIGWRSIMGEKYVKDREVTRL